MPELDGSLSDREILDLDSGPLAAESASASPDASQPTSIPDAQPAQASSEGQPDDYAWAEPVLRDPNVAPQFKAAQERLKTYMELGSVANARVLKQFGLENIKALKAKSDAIAKMDETYYGGDLQTKREFLAGIQRQNPRAFLVGVLNGLNLIRQQDPERFQYLVAPHIAERLQADGLWEWLEHLYGEFERAGYDDLCDRLNQFAGTFLKYGFGPRLSETVEAAERRSAFHTEIDLATTEALGRAVFDELSKVLPNADPQTQAAIVQQAHLELKNAARADRNLLFALSNLLRAAPNRKTGEASVELFVRNLWPMIPSVVKKLIREYGLSEIAPPADSKAKPNGSPAQPKRVDASRLTYRQILDLPPEAITAAKAPKPRAVKLTRDEASKMSFKQIIEDDREVASQ